MTVSEYGEFFKNKTPKSQILIYAERRAAQRYLEKVGKHPLHPQNNFKAFQERAEILVRKKMAEKGLDVKEWTVEYSFQRDRNGDILTPVNIKKHVPLKDQDQEILESIMKELSVMPQDKLLNILQNL